MASVRPEDFDDNRSYWAASAAPVEPTEPLKGVVKADVVVLGAGFTGMSSAWHLQERHPERRIVVLEAKTVGNGASGRNGGLMLNWVNGVPMGDGERTRRVFECTRGGIDGIVSLIERESLPVRFRRDGCLEVYTRSDTADEAQRRAEQLRAWGIPVVWLPKEALDERLRVQGAQGAILDPTAGQLHGLDLLRAMRGRLLARGVAIHEHSPALSVTEGREIRVTTPEGEVRAAAMVLALNGYTPLLGYFKNEVFPLHSHVFATSPLDPGARAALGWGGVAGFSDDLDRIAYGSMAEDGTVVFGGGSNASYSYLYGNRTTYPGSPDSAAAAFDAIRRTFDGYFPHGAGLSLAHRWTGTLGIPLARVCSIGVRGAHRNVYYGVGFAGHGVTLGNLAGRVIADLYDDHHEPWKDQPFYQRSLAWIPPEPLRWVGYQLFTRLTGKSPRRVET